MSSNSHLILFVHTGDRKNSGTNSSVHVILHSDDGQASKPMTLNHVLSNDFERDQIDTFRLPVEDVKDLGRLVNVERIELWKDKTLLFFSDDWYVDKIVVQNTATHHNFEFPLFRWIKNGYHYNFKRLDTSLPQYDEFPEQRKKELNEKMKTYQFDQKMPGALAQVKLLPPDEQFSFEYKWFIASSKYRVKVATFITNLFQKKWRTINDIENIYSADAYDKPGCVGKWDSDIEFGRQRVASINSNIISLLTSVPEKFPIRDDLLGPLLEGLSIEAAIGEKRLFFCDLEILDGIPSRPDSSICSPFALFFVDKERQLRPIAIQLFHEPGPDNPIFTPLDEPMLWNVVKLWYNNADAAFHQSLTHLGLTHLLMEGICIASHRNLSASHPVFKILASHFLYIIAINSLGVSVLVSEGGWVDNTMGIGSKGLLSLIGKGFDHWRMNVEGLLPENLKVRGVYDLDVLPGYHFRDDAMLLFDAIKKYVTSYVDLYYSSQEIIIEDLEIQAWAQELVKERNKSEGGVGLKGVPGNGSINCSEDLVNIITSIIFTCSVAHASANFGQYDEYAYPLRYPTFLKGKPPSTKDVQITEEEIVDRIVTEDMAHKILQISSILSSKATNSLGDFEVQYIFDPEARKLVDTFRQDLKEISKKITARNEKLDTPYEYLLPESIPNSISI